MSVNERSTEASSLLEEFEALEKSLSEKVEDTKKKELVGKFGELLKAYMADIAKQNALLQEALESISNDLQPISSASKMHSQSEGDLLKNAEKSQRESLVLATIEKIKELLESIRRLESQKSSLSTNNRALAKAYAEYQGNC